MVREGTSNNLDYSERGAVVAEDRRVRSDGQTALPGFGTDNEGPVQTPAISKR